MNYNKYPNYCKPWSKKDIKTLVLGYTNKMTIHRLSEILGRTEGGITCKLESLGLYSVSEKPVEVLKEKKISLNKEIAHNELKAKELLDELAARLNTIRDLSSEYLYYKNTERMIDPYVLNLESMLLLSIKDMVNNGWYKDIEEAKFFLRDRINKGEF